MIERNESTVAKTASILAAMARAASKPYGVQISVGLDGGELVFLDEAGHPVLDPILRRDIVVAAADELQDGSYLKLFAGRVLYAALCERFNLEAREAA